MSREEFWQDYSRLDLSYWYSSYETLRVFASLLGRENLFSRTPFCCVTPSWFCFTRCFLSFVASTMSTRASSVAEFTRIVQTVLGYNDKSDVWLALTTDLMCSDLVDFAALDDAAIDAAVNPGTAQGSNPAVPVSLSKKDKRILKCLLKYGHYHALLRTNGVIDWSLLADADAWNDFLTTVIPAINAHGSIAAAAKAAISAASQSTASSGTQVKAEISAYQKFSGNLTDWLQYRRTLCAVATAQGMGEVLVDYTTDPRASLAAGSIQLKEFNSKSGFIYSVFSSTVKGGYAMSILRDHETTLDGRQVFVDLVKWYESKENLEHLANDCIEKLGNIKLQYSSKGGMNTFITSFKEILADLEQAKAPVATSQKKPLLLTKVEDKSYQSVKDILAHDSNADFNVCCRELSLAATKIEGARKRSANEVTTSGGGSKQKTKAEKDADANFGKAFIPPSIFKKWTEGRQAEHKKRLAALRAKKQGTPGGGGASGGSTSNSVTITPAAGATKEDVEASIEQVRQVLLTNISSSSTDQTPNKVSVRFGNVAHRLFRNTKRAIAFRQNVRSARAGNSITSSEFCLADSGANQTVFGPSWHTFDYTDRSVSMEGFSSDFRQEGMTVCSGMAVVQTDDGERVIILVHEGSRGNDLGCKSLLSKSQVERHGHRVNDSARKYGGLQNMVLHDGTVLPLTYRNGVCGLEINTPSSADMDSCRVIELTRDEVHQPETTENDGCDEPSWDDFSAPSHTANATLLDPIERVANESFANVSTTSGWYIPELSELFLGDQSLWSDPSWDMDPGHAIVMPTTAKPTPVDYDRARECLLYKPLSRVKATFDNTTQFAKNVVRLPMRKHFAARSPALNVRRLHEPYATDTFFSSDTAREGFTMVQLYTGKTSLHTQIYGMRQKSQMVETLKDFTREIGAPSGLLSDNAPEEIQEKVQEWLRSYHIPHWTSEPHYQNQNPAERRIGDVKRTTMMLMDRTGTPDKDWFLCMKYIVYVLNRMSHEVLDNKTPIEVGLGVTPDISACLQFRWYEPVYYRDSDSFPHSQEKPGRFVGIAEHCGDALTYLILTEDTQQIIARSVVRPRTTKDPNLRGLSADDGEGAKDSDQLSDADSPSSSSESSFQLTASSENADTHPSEIPRLLDPHELIGTLVLYETDNGEKFRARVEEEVETGKFLLSMSDGAREELISYVDLCRLMQKHDDDESEDRIWTFSKIDGHRKVSGKYEVHTFWDTGETTWEPLSVMAKADPITCAIYAKDNGLLNEPGWKHLRRHVKTPKRYIRAVRRIALAQKHGRTGVPKFQFGVEIPRDYAHAMELDKKNGNDLWAQAIKSEIDGIHGYKVFIDKGTDIRNVPDDYKPLRCHFVFAAKWDGRRKARLVAGGHRTEDPKDGVFAGIANLRSVRICCLLAELNGLEIWSADIAQAYLEAKTREKLYVKAGPEFGDLAGHFLVMDKGLYGTHSAGFRFAEHLADALRDFGWTQSKADPAVWMKQYGDRWGYIVSWVDDLLIMTPDNAAVLKDLQSRFKKLKDVGAPEYYLGGDFKRESGTEDVLTLGSKTYVKRMLDQYEKLFGSPPAMKNDPLPSRDHPELDVSDLCDDKDRSLYQSLIGMLQWAVTLGRYDIMAAVQSLSSFRAMPRVGHLEKAKRIFGYLRKYNDGSIKFRTNIPDYSDREFLGDVEGWRHIYGELSEELPWDMPTPLGKLVRLSTYVDANLMHCHITGRACTGYLTFLNSCPIDWYSKKQSTVETATYGSEFVAARVATEHIMDLRYTLRMLGAPLDGPAYMFGDNMSVVTSSTVPTSTLKKRHNALSYHRIREAIAMKIIKFGFVGSKDNFADPLTKFLSNGEAYPLLKPHLFWPSRSALDSVTPDPHSDPRGVAEDSESRPGQTARAIGRVAMVSKFQIGKVQVQFHSG